MVRWIGTRRMVTRAAGMVGAALLLRAGAPGLAGQTAHAAPAAARISLVGVWVGNALTGPGRCGKQSGQFTFFRNGEYAYTQNSDYNYAAAYPYTCGGFTNAGYFSLRSGVLTLHWVECNFPCAPGTVSARLAFINANAFEIANAGQAFYYYRQ